MKKFQNKFDAVQAVMGMTDKGRQQVLSINKANDPDRKYRELYIELGNQLMKVYRYEPSIEEIHHTQKKDTPSGTAITLAEQIILVSDKKTKWVNTTSKHENELQIISKRLGEVPGTHSVKYSSAIDDIEIIHTAHNRKGFAEGAVLAAEFIAGKKGIFSMKDVLNF